MANIDQLLNMGSPRGANPMRMAIPRSDGNPFDRIEWGDVLQAMSPWKPGDPEPQGPFLTQPQAVMVWLRHNPAMVESGAVSGLLTNYLWQALIDWEDRRRPKAPSDPSPAERAIYASAAQARARRQAAMVRTALAEYLDPRLCRTCYRSREEGKVLVQVEGRGMVWQSCPRCHGNGWIPWSDNRRAKSIGGDRNAYTTRVAPGYDYVMRVCKELYLTGTKAFKQRLFLEGTAYDDLETRLQARA